MIKNVNTTDIALIELASGRKTDAPVSVLQQLRASGFLTLDRSNRPTLTKTGRARGLALAGQEQFLREDAARTSAARAAGRMPLCAIPKRYGIQS